MCPLDIVEEVVVKHTGCRGFGVATESPVNTKTR